MLNGHNRDTLIATLSGLDSDTRTILCTPKNLIVYSVIDTVDDGITCLALDTNHATLKDIIDGYYSNRDSKTKRLGKIRTQTLFNAGFCEDDVEDIKKIGFFLQYHENGSSYSFVLDNEALNSLSEVLNVTFKGGIIPARDLYLSAILKSANPFSITFRKMENAGRVLLFHKESLRPSPLSAVCELFQNFPLAVKKWEITSSDSSNVFVYLEYMNMSVKVGSDEVSFGVKFEVSERKRECIAIQNVLYYKGEAVWFSKRLHQIASMETSVSRLCDKYNESENTALEDAKIIIEKATSIHVANTMEILEKFSKFLNLDKEFGKSNLKKLEARTGFKEDSDCTLAEILMFFVMLPASTDGTFKEYAIEKLRKQISSLLHPDSFNKLLAELGI